MNVLFVGAHPGDIEVHAGGTAALYSRLGHKLFFVVCTEGYQNGKEVAKRYQETEKAADKIGASLVWMGFDSGFLVDRPASRMAFIESFRRAQPDVVICHAPYDSDPDHAISGQIVDDCIHMGCIPLIKTESQRMYHIPHVYYMDTIAGRGAEHELYVDISGVFSFKCDLAFDYTEKNLGVNQTDFSLREFLKTWAKFRGYQSGCQMAEAFRPSYQWGRTFKRHYLPIAETEIKKGKPFQIQEIYSHTAQVPKSSRLEEQKLR